MAADSSSEPPQPSRLEKKRNTPLRYPAMKRREPTAILTWRGSKQGAR